MYCAEGWWDITNNSTATQVGLDINETLNSGWEEIIYLPINLHMKFDFLF